MPNPSELYVIMGRTGPSNNPDEWMVEARTSLISANARAAQLTMLMRQLGRSGTNHDANEAFRSHPQGDPYFSTHYLKTEYRVYPCAITFDDETTFTQRLLK